jgi:hypothetical protein
VPHRSQSTDNTASHADMENRPASTTDHPAAPSSRAYRSCFFRVLAARAAAVRTCPGDVTADGPPDRSPLRG